MKPTQCAGLVVVLFAASAAPAAGARLELSRWSHRAEVEIAKPPGKGLVEFTLTPGVFDLARADLADLRVVNEVGEVPYLLRVAQGRSRREPVPRRLYNRTYVPGRQSSATADFERKVLKNRIRIETPGTNFRRRVLVEGSDDGEAWQVVREGAFLFRVERGAEGAGYDRNVVELPENDQRYLRVTVQNGPDDPERVEIRDLAVWRLVREPPEIAAVPVVARGVVEKEKERATEIALDLGLRNLPLCELTLVFGDADFFRRVRVSGRNRTERIVTRRVEDAPALEKKIPEPWTLITSGAIWRYTSGGSADESLTIDLRGAKYRYVLVRIENRDDAPLRFTGASVTRLVCRVSFPPKGEAFTLYFGNAAARRPAYDLAHYVKRLRDEGVARAVLRELAGNPSHVLKERAPPWSERHKFILWAALALVLVALGALVYRQAKSAGAAAEKGEGPQGDEDNKAE